MLYTETSFTLRKGPPGAARQEKGMTESSQIARLHSAVAIGSADAAATMHLLNRMWKLGLSAEKLAQAGAKLGADIPMCLMSRPLLAKGIGERIALVGGVPPLARPTGHGRKVSREIPRVARRTTSQRGSNGS